MVDNEQRALHEQTTIKDISPARAVKPIWPPPPRPRPPQGPPKALKITSLILAALLVVGGLGFVIYATTNQYNGTLTSQQRAYLRATVDTQATSASSLAATAQPLATAQAQIYASATAQAQATADSQNSGDQSTATATALGNMLTQDTSGTPALNDPLVDNSLNFRWDVGLSDNNNTGCNFSVNGYEVQEALQGFVHTCFADATNFSNFVYKISMTITTGNEGGVVFRGDSANGQYYLFRIDINGNYAFELYDGKAYTLLASGFSSAILTGLDESNDLAVIADKGAFYLFVNQTYVDGANNTALKTGQIGVAAYNTSLPATVDFSNAEVWTLSS